MNWKSIDGIRAFNRAYLSAFDLYDQNYLHSGYTKTEARVLYELYERKCCSANDLISSIHIDKGYMSRLLKRFRQAGMIERTVSERDGRVQLMVLTEYGLEVTENLIRRSREQISSALEHLTEEELQRLDQLLSGAVALIQKPRAKD